MAELKTIIPFNTFTESGRATTPPNLCYSSLLSSASEEFAHSITAASRNTSGQHNALISQSPTHSAYYFNNLTHQRTQSGYIPDYPPCSNPLSYFSSTKTDVNDHSFPSPHYSTDYFTSQTRSPSYSPVNNSFSYSNSNNNEVVNVSGSQNNSDFGFSSNSKISSKDRGDFNVEEELSFQCSEQFSPASVAPFNSSKIVKSNLLSSPKQIPSSSDTLIAPASQVTCGQNKDTFNSCLDKNSKEKRNSEGSQKLLKTSKDDYFEESLRSETIIKNVHDTSQELVTDSLLHLFHKKNSQDNLSYDLGDISPILVSLTNKFMSEEGSGLKKKETNEDFKLMNEFLTKIILEKEEKRFKAFDEKKKIASKETFDDLSNELSERKVKRDAMSHYQEDKNHKKGSNFGDYSHWEYFGQQDIQSSNNLSRRGPFSFGNTSQQHSIGWNQMGIGIPRQTNPYYANPHSHMMPAHAHSDYRYNQWNNPNHKSLPNVHNAHSQNSVLPQAKMDIKHHADISSSVQDFGRSIGSTSDFSKFRPGTRDLMHRTPPPVSEKSIRGGVRPDIVTSISPGIRNSPIRAPPIAGHPKTVINNPLSDLQMLVTNQEHENPSQKNDNFQQESVDLSAQKQKDNRENDASNVNNKEIEDFRTSVSVIQIQNKHVKSDLKESEKPVALTSKSSEKNSELEISPAPRENNLNNKKTGSSHVVESAKESVTREELKVSKSPVKTSVIVGKSEESSSNDAGIPKNVQSSASNDKNEEKKKEKEKEKSNEEKKEVEEKGKSTPEEGSKKTDVAEVSIDKHEEPIKCNDINETVPEKAVKSPEEKCDKKVEITENCKRRAEDEQPSPDKKKVLLEAEPQQQKAFGPVEEEIADLPTVTSTSTDAKQEVLHETVKKTPKKKPSRKSRTGRLSSGQSSGSERSLPCKKSKGLGTKEESRKRAKKSLCDMMDRRGPFLHVTGSRESPAVVTLVNFPKGDDEDEKDKSSVKKQILNSSRTKHHNELDYRGRSRNGLYCSTLSTRYDAHTTDYTWICVFCKKGPHYNTLGDLFGPYIISEDENNALDNFSGDEKDISDAQKRGGRNKKSLRSNNMVEHFQKMSKKLRRAQSTGSCLTGMTVISDDQVNQLRYEVWVHEQCAVWSPNVFLIGSRLIGMQEAIWGSVKTVCSKCGVPGANIGCVYRNCPNRSHYHCAKECGWSLQQETFISTCHIHKPRS